MKKILIAAMTISVIATTGSVFAMESMDSMSMSGHTMMQMSGGTMMHNTMMKKDDEMMMSNDGMMMKDTMMMKKDGMMNAKAKGTVFNVAKYYGYNWATQKAKLATMAGIENYRGTKKQNLMIRAYLIKNDTMMSR